MRHLIIFSIILTLLVSNVFAQNPARAGKDYALFFVVTDFDNWPDLPGSDQDVRTLAAELETNYGFQKPDIRVNPTKAQILAALEEYRKRRYGAQDQLLVFFSMHGYYDDAIGALIPRDGKLDDPSYESWLLHPALEAVLSKLPCPHTLLALDACYSGTFGAKYRDKPQRPAFEELPTDCAGKARAALQKTSRLYCTSGGKERTPAKSQFAAKWLEALRTRNGDGLLSFPELYAVLLEARPQAMYGDFRGHDAGGDFVFVRKSLCGSSPADPIESDKAAWKEAKLSNTVYAYNDYIKRYSQGLYVEEAGEAIKRIPSVNSTAVQKGASLPTNGQVHQPSDILDGFVFVQGATFQMGSRKGSSDEKPVHAVTVGSFYMSKYEVTVGEYLRFADETQSHYPDWLEKGNSLNIETGTNSYYKVVGYSRQTANLPIVGISWEDCIAYCQWLSAKTGETYRLPTEAEWEFAARGGNHSRKRVYAGSNTAAEVAWTSENSAAGPRPIGGRKPNELGLYDMCGNVQEWCSDWYGPYSSSAQTNATGPNSGSFRVLRGGSWIFEAQSCTVVDRDYFSPNYKSHYMGFRPVRTP